MPPHRRAGEVERRLRREGSLRAGGGELVLSGQGGGGEATGVAFGWSMWPVLTLYGVNGVVAFPFNASVSA